MNQSIFQLISLCVTYVLFGYCGYRLSKRFKRPFSLLTWAILVLATLGAITFMRSALLVGFFELKIFVNTAVQALGVGIIIGLAAREIMARHRAEAQTGDNS